jgi:recombination protein RecT
MLKHADTNSPAFKAADYARLQKGDIPESELWKYSSFWYKDFDGLAFKTLIRQLISKWGIMSIDLIAAIESDSEPNDFNKSLVEGTEIKENTDHVTASVEQGENNFFND